MIIAFCKYNKNNKKLEDKIDGSIKEQFIFE